MPLIPTCVIPFPKPAASSAVVDVNKIPLITGDPSLIYFGDDTTMVNTGGAVSAWGTRVSGGPTYAPATTPVRPAYLTSGGPITGLAYADFIASSDSSADRLLWSGTTYAVNAPHTVIDLCRLDVTTKVYLDGGESGTTDFISGTCYQGAARQSFGNAIASVPMGTGVWSIVTRSWDGAGNAEVHVNGVRDAQLATIQPTTARILHMACTSTAANAATFDGAIALRMRFTKFIGADRTFFLNIVGAYLQERYQLAKNPIAVV